MSKTETKFDPLAIRSDFPILQQTIHRNRQLVYLDNGASTQHPVSVLQAMNDCYQKSYANVHRGIHWLSEQSTEQFELARQKIQTFIGAEHSEQVIFFGGTTSAINCVARAWGDANVGPGDRLFFR